MKTILSILTALALSASIVTASPTPTPTPVASKGMELTEADLAAVRVAQIVSSLNETFAGLKVMFETGIPAQQNQQTGQTSPAISAEALRKAMGDERVKRIEAAQKALNGGK